MPLTLLPPHSTTTTTTKEAHAMPVDPFVQQMLPVPPMPDPLEDWDAYRAEGRAQLAALVGAVMQPAPDGVQTSRVDLPVEGGSIVLSVHRPVDQTGPLPGHLYLHGGGWVAGDGDSPAQDIICGERAVGAQCIVVAADYRKAPEHAFPTGLDDCLAALTWMVDHADDLGLDTDRISVGGGSAGANLAAALTLRVRDEGGPRLHFQLLEVPALDLTLSLPSHNDESLGTDYALAASDVHRLIDLYLQGADPTHPYASPLLADDLTGLPRRTSCRPSTTCSATTASGTPSGSTTPASPPPSPSAGATSTSPPASPPSCPPPTSGATKSSTP